MKVVIVGAGIIGLAVADELTRRGVQVELLEKGPQAGREASWAAAGILTPQGEAKGPGPFLDLLLAGYQLIPEALRRLETATRMDLSYRASGVLKLALTEADESLLKEELAWQEKVGLRFDILSPEEVKRLEPALDGAIRRGIWFPQTAQVDNTRMVEAYIRLVQSQGGLIRVNTEVKQLLLEGDRVVGVVTPSGRFKADWVVNCAGAFAGFDRLIGLEVPAIPVRGQILKYTPSYPWVERVIQSPRAYLVQRDATSLIAGTTVEYVGFDKGVTQEGRRAISRGVEEICSGLKTLTPSQSWAGLRPGTPDGLPILGPTPLKQLLLATGHFRNGILLAPLTGRMIADWVTGSKVFLDWSPFSVTRFLAKAAKSGV